VVRVHALEIKGREHAAKNSRREQASCRVPIKEPKGDAVAFMKESGNIVNQEPYQQPADRQPSFQEGKIRKREDWNPIGGM
jgi:hypothetical protein